MCEADKLTYAMRQVISASSDFSLRSQESLKPEIKWFARMNIIFHQFSWWFFQKLVKIQEDRSQIVREGPILGNL